ncbi:MAG: hydroxyethylthiazole kinase [Aggregatilineales bacterium]
MPNTVAELNGRIAQVLARLRAVRPLLHHITNLVVMNDVANLTLHVGALPVMGHAVEEVADIVNQAGALALNLGTLTPARTEAMLIAGHRANERGIPIILDPVGVGGTALRTEVSLRLLNELKIAVVRGNAAEIGKLSSSGGIIKGVESVEGVSDPVGAARTLARKYGTVVAIGGQRDVVADGRQVMGVENGHMWLTTITGSGCMATAMVAAFAAVEPDYLLATIGGLVCFGVAAELAASSANGPASFKVGLFDQLYALTPEKVAQAARVIVFEPGTESF